MAKAQDAFRTIGEVSDELDVPKHVLRFWEGRFPQLKPMKRGGGRRFYRPEDVALLRGIHHLLHKAGYTIRGVQRLLREHGPDSVKIADGAVAPEVAIVAAPAKSKAKPKAGTKQARPAVLAAEHVATLVKVMAELDACVALLKPR